MENNKLKAKKELKDVTILVFGMTFILALFMIYAYNMHVENLIMGFALIQMLIPAMAVILLKEKYNKENGTSETKGVASFYKVYKINFVVSVLILVIGTIAIPKYVYTLLSIPALIFSILTLIKVIQNDENDMDSINMVIKKNIKLVVIVALIFLGTKLIAFLPDIIIGSEDVSVTALMTSLVMLPITMALNLLTYIVFFGEEFCWRGYMQPRLQLVLGKKLGVLVLGAIWGIWHMPLCFMLYSPESPIQCVLLHVFFCTLMGIFMSYAYMKTENLWSVIIIHLINNSLAANINPSMSSSIGWTDLIVAIILLAIIYVPFIFTKEYKEDIQDIQITQ